MSDPEISVLIPVWNGAHQIDKCLDAIAAQTLDRSRFEVVVVDNGSTDNTAEIVGRYPFVTLLSEPGPGSYRARNTGLATLRGRYVALTDADCVPEPDWLEKALTAVSTIVPQPGIVAGRIELFRLSPEDSRTCEAYERLFNLNQENYAANGHCATANWTSPIEVLRGLGGFNATLKSSGDFEMSGRVVAAGHPLVYAHDIMVRHPTRGQPGDLLTKRLRVVGGQWTLKKVDRSALRFSYETFRLGGWQFKQAALKGPAEPWLRVKLMAFVAFLTIASMVEHLRLVLGGEPRRA